MGLVPWLGPNALSRLVKYKCDRSKQYCMIGQMMSPQGTMVFVTLFCKKTLQNIFFLIRGDKCLYWNLIGEDVLSVVIDYLTWLIIVPTVCGIGGESFPTNRRIEYLLEKTKRNAFLLFETLGQVLKSIITNAKVNK